MSVAAPIIAALEQYEFDSELGFLPSSKLSFSATGTLHILTRLQRWRVVQCLNELGSALRSLVDVLANPCHTTPSNPVGVAPVLRVQELAANRENLALLYRVLASGEKHTDDEIKGIIARIPHPNARECSEVEVFSSALVTSLSSLVRP
ncbi:hypothetical protein IL306_002341 [Fusarium sp. DS 682]|nr:hypothetical protein IL306_002341 [Fusarium sp. DS 682]